MSAPRKAHCKYGHPLSGANLYVTTSGKTRCKECQRRFTREAKRRARAKDRVE